MAAAGSELPSFREPPLEEVALAVQFQPNAIDLLDAARYADVLRSDFPLREDQVGRPPMREDFGPPTEQAPIQFELITGAPPQRFWFLTEDRTGLVQLQADTLVFNWRRSPDGEPVGDPYPRYPRLREELDDRYSSLEDIVKLRGETLRPNWCEVTYINHIAAEDAHSQRPQLRQVLRGIEQDAGSGFLPASEDAQLALRYRIPGPDAPRGRLTVTVAPAIRKHDLTPLWVMTLTARLLAADETREAALAALDVGREWVVRGFDELTSEQMHEQWGKEVSNAASN